MGVQPVQAKFLQHSAGMIVSEKEKALHNRAVENGRSAGARTPDPLIKSQLLYQLSYASIREIREPNDSPA